MNKGNHAFREAFKGFIPISDSKLSFEKRDDKEGETNKSS
jgi:hypothetical protein